MDWRAYSTMLHDDVIKWKHFPRYWPFVGGIHRSLVNSPHKGQWRGALMFSLICTRINGWVNNGEAGDLRRYRVHYDVIVMYLGFHHWHWGQAYDMMTSSSNGNIFRVTGHLCREFTRNFDVFLDLRLNKRLSKQSRGWWYETLSSPLWRHCN